MTTNIIPAPFTLSDAAVRQIGRLRSEYLSHSPGDPPVMPGVNLARRLFDDGSFGPEKVIVGFWRASEFKDADFSLVQRISGVELVFPIPPKDLPAFVGKEIDYRPEDGFFPLRTPLTERHKLFIAHSGR